MPEPDNDPTPHDVRMEHLGKRMVVRRTALENGVDRRREVVVHATVTCAKPTDCLAAIDRLASAFRYRNALYPDSPLQVSADDWVQGEIQEALVNKDDRTPDRYLPVFETFAQFFAVRSLTPVWRRTTNDIPVRWPRSVDIEIADLHTDV